MSLMWVACTLIVPFVTFRAIKRLKLNGPGALVNINQFGPTAIHSNLFQLPTCRIKKINGFFNFFKELCEFYLLFTLNPFITIMGADVKPNNVSPSQI